MWLTHLEFDATNPFIRHWFDAMGERDRFVRYDARGVASPVPAPTPSKCRRPSWPVAGCGLQVGTSTPRSLRPAQPRCELPALADLFGLREQRPE